MCDAGKYLGIDNMRDMDYVITTRELAKWAKEENIDFTSLKDSKFDSLMGLSLIHILNKKLLRKIVGQEVYEFISLML